MPAHPLQLTCLGVIIGTPLLASIFVTLRIYTRRKLNARLSWDDWLIIVPSLFSLALIGPSYKHVKMWHIGIHIWEVPQDKLEPNYDEYYAVVMAFNLLNIPILPLVKASIILLLLRAGSVIEWLKKALYIILVFIMGSCLIPWFLYIFICPPLTGNTWKPRTFGGLHCMGRHKMGEMLIWITCANLFTDILILPIPFIIVRKMMSTRLRSRLVVLAVFNCSLLATAIGAAKIYLSYRDRLYTLFKPDWTYPIDYCINHIENNVAIIVANIPILRGLVTRWVFSFKTKATPLDPACRGERRWHTSPPSDSNRQNRMVQKDLPYIEEGEFVNSLDDEHFKQDIQIQCNTHHESRLVTSKDYAENESFCLALTTSSLSRYDTADSCEKGDITEINTFVAHQGTIPTMVHKKEIDVDLDSLDSQSLSLSSTKRCSSVAASPIAPLTRCQLRGIKPDGEEQGHKYPNY